VRPSPSLQADTTHASRIAAIGRCSMDLTQGGFRARVNPVSRIGERSGLARVDCRTRVGDPAVFVASRGWTGLPWRGGTYRDDVLACPCGAGCGPCARDGAGDRADRPQEHGAAGQPASGGDSAIPGIRPRATAGAPSRLGRIVVRVAPNLGRQGVHHLTQVRSNPRPGMVFEEGGLALEV